jgi:hypothetical protein
MLPGGVVLASPARTPTDHDTLTGATTA